MNKSKKEIKSNRIKFNTYCTFTEEKHEVKETIGQIFKDYIEKNKNS